MRRCVVARRVAVAEASARGATRVQRAARRREAGAEPRYARTQQGVLCEGEPLLVGWRGHSIHLTPSSQPDHFRRDVRVDAPPEPREVQPLAHDVAPRVIRDASRAGAGPGSRTTKLVEVTDEARLRRDGQVRSECQGETVPGTGSGLQRHAFANAGQSSRSRENSSSESRHDRARATKSAHSSPCREPCVSRHGSYR